MYITFNTFFYEIFDLSCILNDLVGVESGSVKLMGKNMRVKFNQYLSDPDKMNFFIFMKIFLTIGTKLNACHINLIDYMVM